MNTTDTENLGWALKVLGENRARYLEQSARTRGGKAAPFNEERYAREYAEDAANDSFKRENA